MKERRVPNPRERPTEYAAFLVGAVLALVSQFVDLPEGTAPAVVAVVAPIVTWVVSRSEGSRGQA